MDDDGQKVYSCGKCGNNWFGPKVDNIMPHWVICPYCGNMFQCY